MAIIGTIRKNSWLLIVVIGLALASFVIMDMFTGSSKYGVQNMTLGEVNGEKIDYREFNEMDEALYGGTNTDIFARRNYLWSFFTNKLIANGEGGANGFGISKEEMDDVQFGTNISPIIYQRFTDPNTGQIDMTRLQSTKQAIQSGQLTDPVQRRYWAFQEKEIVADRMAHKLSTALSKGFYTPNWQAAQINEDQNRRAEFEYLKWGYDTLPVAENQLTVSDADIRSYMQENKSDLLRESEQRVPQFTAIRVLPTAADTAIIVDEVAQIAKSFAEAENDTTFIRNNNGNFWTEYRIKDNVDPAYADQVFSEPVGTVLGPIITGNQVVTVKILDRDQIADSVRSRHILRSFQTQDEAFQAFALLDSLKKEIEEGRASFAALARTNSQDGSASQGGDLGYATTGQMVKPFNDLIFFQAEEGELNIIQSQFGLHLVEVTDRKYSSRNEGVQLAVVARSVVPSDATQDSIYKEAETLVATCRTLEELRNAVREKGLRLQNGNPVSENDYSFGFLGSGSEAREMVKWMYEPSTKVDAVSPVVYSFQNPALYYTETVVILGLKEIQAKGMPTLEEVRAIAEPIIRNRKKADVYIRESLGNSIEIDALAARFNMQKQKGNGVSFATDIINGVGDEPEVVAAVAQLDEGQNSRPIKGKSGIFVVKVISKPDAPQQASWTAIKTQNDQGMKQQARPAMMKSLKDAANIVDDRSTYY